MNEKTDEAQPFCWDLLLLYVLTTLAAIGAAFATLKWFNPIPLTPSVGSAIYLWHPGTPFFSFPPPSVGGRSASSVIAVMSTLVTVSGITVPGVVAYLNLRERDVERYLSERFFYHLEKRGIDEPRLRAAFITMIDTSIRGIDANATIRAVYESFSLRFTGVLDDGLSAEIKSLVLPASTERKNYDRYYHSSRHASIALQHAYFVSFGAAVTFACLYIRHFEFISNIAFDAIESATIWFSIVANVLTYRVMLRLTSLRRNIKVTISSTVPHLADEVLERVTKAEDLKRQAELKLDQTGETMAERLGKLERLKSSKNAFTDS